MINIYRAYKSIISRFTKIINHIICIIKFQGYGVNYSSFRTTGIPYIFVAQKGYIKIGKHFAMNNGVHGNPIGCYEKCTFFVGPNCDLKIGDNVGISQTALICYAKLTIGNNVKIGGGTCIWTTDFHSLDAHIRRSSEDFQYKKCEPIVIEDNVFIGAKSLILKGVSIGENSIIGAGSVVTKSIPANEIWGGNPAKFIRKI